MLGVCVHDAQGTYRANACDLYTSLLCCCLTVSELLLANAVTNIDKGHHRIRKVHKIRLDNR